MPGALNELCTPRCDSTRPKNYAYVFVDGIPSGACSVPSEACSTALQVLCLCPGSPPTEEDGARHGVDCVCRDGQWSCRVVSQGAGGCQGQGCVPATPADLRDAGVPGY